MTTSLPRMLRVPCGMCGSDESKDLFRLRRSRIVQCLRCGFAYVSPRVPSEVLRKRLQEWSREDVVDQERLRIAFDDGTVRLYKTYLSRLEKLRRTPGRRLLDVGCSTGAFLSVARSEGWDVHGLELGTAASAYAQDELCLDVSRASLHEYTPPAGSYDAVVILEVIEHLEAPAEALRRIATWLKPGGLLLLSTPNFNSLYRRIHGPKWWVVNCEEEHVVFFTPSTLRRGLEDAGFEVLSARSAGFDLPGMVRSTFSHGLRGRDEEAPPSGDYYSSRRIRERIKTGLRALGALELARGAKGITESLSSAPWSPLYGLGERLAFIAARRSNHEPAEPAL